MVVRKRESSFSGEQSVGNILIHKCFLFDIWYNKNMNERKFDIGVSNSNWVLRRKLILNFAYIVIVLFVCVYAFNFYLKSKIVAPSCNDKIMNQNEGGIDCEGECVKICREHMSEIKVLYAKAISSGYNTYDLVAMIENDNVGKIPSPIPYIFRVYNGIGVELASSTGKLDIEDGVKMPLIVPNIHINNSDNPATTLYTTLELGHYDMYPTVVHKEKVKVIDYRGAHLPGP